MESVDFNGHFFFIIFMYICKLNLKLSTNFDFVMCTAPLVQNLTIWNFTFKLELFIGHLNDFEYCDLGLYFQEQIDHLMMG